MKNEAFKGVLQRFKIKKGMLGHIKNLIFKKNLKLEKIKYDALEDAFSQNLITKEELLTIKKNRADTELKEYLKEKKQK